jgi:medium-chain acyl-[acyl-carrier-protein] hydrolase
MDTSDLIHRETFRVQALDADAGNHLSPGALARFLQEIAAASADRLGFGYEALRARNHAWVLHGLRIQIAQRPGYHQLVHVATWPRELVRLLAFREFLVTDDDGRPVAAASSAWVVMDATTRRLVRPDPYLDRPWRPDRVLDRDPAPPPALTDPDAELKVRVRWTDLDLNGHLNNTRFLDLALETFADDWLLAHAPTEVEMSFLAEGRRGDVLLSRRQPQDEGSFLHSLVREADGKELFRARTVWR